MNKVKLNIEYSPTNKFHLIFYVPDEYNNDSDILNYLLKKRYLDSQEEKHVVSIDVEDIETVTIEWLQYVDMSDGISYEEGDTEEVIILETWHDVVDMSIDEKTYKGINQDWFKIL
jgi:hypothetical protein